MRFSYLAAPALSLAALLIPSLAAHAADIRIGAVVDQAGISAEASRDYLAGARTYFDHVNANGGIRGRKLALLVKDDEGVPANTLRLTHDLVGAERVDLLFGYSGDENIELVAKDSAFRASRVVLYGPLSGAEIGDASDSLVFVRPTYRDEAKHIVQHFTRLHLSRFAVVHVASAFGRSLSAAVADELKNTGLKPASDFEFDASLARLDATARNMMKAAPQVVIVAADTIATAEFIKRLRALPQGMGVNVVGLSTVNHRTLMKLARADNAAGTMITQVVPNPLASTTKLQTEHLTLMAKYRDEPSSHLTLEGFMAAKGLVKALERIPGDINRASIAAAFSGVKRYDLDGMTLAFSGSNDRGSRFVDIAYLRKSGRLVQ